MAVYSRFCDLALSASSLNKNKIMKRILVVISLLSATCVVAQTATEPDLAEVASSRVSALDSVVSLDVEQKSKIDLLYTQYSEVEIEAAKLGKGSPEYKQALVMAKESFNAALAESLTPEQLELWQIYWDKKTNRWVEPSPEELSEELPEEGV